MTTVRKDRMREIDDNLPSADATKSKPPLGRRFQPSQSGNPWGRPVGARNRAQVVKRVMAEVDAVIGSRTRKPMILDLLLLRLRECALSGEREAIRVYHRYLETMTPSMTSPPLAAGIRPYPEPGPRLI